MADDEEEFADDYAIDDGGLIDEVARVKSDSHWILNPC